MAGGEIPSSAVPEENQTPPPETEKKKLPFRKFVDRLRTIMVDLDAKYEQTTGDVEDQKAYARDTLAKADKYLRYLERDYPDEQEVVELLMMLMDLEGDLLHNEDLQLDAAWDTIMADIQENIQEAGVGEIEADEMEPGLLKNAYEQLQAAGIEPAYMVGNKGFPNAPVIILSAQIHATPGMNDEEATRSGIVDSQAVIENTIRTLLSSGLTNAVFAEGIPAKEKWSQQKAQRMFSRRPSNRFSAPLKLKAELGEKVDLLGYEDKAMHSKTFDDLVSGRFFKSLQTRGSVSNIWMARNVAAGMEKGGYDAAHMVLGKSHEILEGTSALMHGSDEHPLPISRLLAYEGFNVIVIDTENPGFGRSPKQRGSVATKHGGGDEREYPSPGLG